MKQKNKKILLLPVLLTAAAVIAGILLYRKFAPSKERVKPGEYYTAQMLNAIEADRARALEQGLEPDEADESVLREGEAAVICDDTVQARRALWLYGTVYLDYEMMRDTLTSRFYWDEENKRMLFTTADATWEIPLGSRTCIVGDGGVSTDNPIVVEQNGRLYFDSSFLEPYVNMEISGEVEDYHILIRTQWGSAEAADVSRDCVMRTEPSVKAPILTDLTAGDELRILDEAEGKWLKAETGNGYIGYVEKKRLENLEEREFTHPFEPEVIPDQCLDEKVGLVWHMVDRAEANSTFDDAVKNMSGVNVISPTWLRLQDNEGNVTSIADKTYVEKAHDAGLQVWALVDNFSPETTTAEIISSTKTRKNLVKNLIQASLDAGVDGINLDLEYIYTDMGRDYVQLVRELSVECRKNSLILSVDIPVPMSFNTYFDREQLGAFADYVIVMGYDEHYAGSEIGTSASLAFEENGIVGTLESVPAKKIISGIPFFNRIWYSRTNEAGESETVSEEIGMKRAAQLLEEYNLTPDWDNQTQQNYIAWVDNDGNYCQLWLEDAQSIALKAGLVPAYDLGGAAAWMLTQETDDVWPIFEEALDITDAPAEEETEQAQEESETGTESAAEDETETGTESLAGFEPGTESLIEGEPGTESVREGEPGTESLIEGEAGTESLLEGESETETETESETEAAGISGKGRKNV